MLMLSGVPLADKKRWRDLRRSMLSKRLGVECPSAGSPCRVGVAGSKLWPPNPAPCLADDCCLTVGEFAKLRRRFASLLSSPSGRATDREGGVTGPADALGGIMEDMTLALTGVMLRGSANAPLLCCAEVRDGVDVLLLVLSSAMDASMPMTESSDS